MSKEYGIGGLHMYQLDGPTIMSNKPVEMSWRQYYEFLGKQRELHMKQVAQKIQMAQRETQLGECWSSWEIWDNDSSSVLSLHIMCK